MKELMLLLFKPARTSFFSNNLPSNVGLCRRYQGRSERKPEWNLKKVDGFFLTKAKVYHPDSNELQYSLILRNDEEN